MPKHKNLVVKKCTPKEDEFCHQFLVDLNATQAAIRAKYSERSARQIAARLLSKDYIQTRIAELRQELKERTGITSQRILKELETLGFSRIDDYVEIDEGGGLKLKTFNEIPEDKRGAIKAIKEDRVIREVPGKNGHEEIVIHDKTRYELHDKIRPLIKLGEHVGLFDQEFPAGDGQQTIHQDFKIMIINVNGKQTEKIDLTKMINIGKKLANHE